MVVKFAGDVQLSVYVFQLFWPEPFSRNLYMLLFASFCMRSLFLLPFVLVFFFLVTLSSASALVITSYKLVATVVSKDTVDSTLELMLLNNDSSPLLGSSLSLALDAEILSVSDSYGDLVYTVEDETLRRLSFTFSTPLSEGGSRLVRISTRGHSSLVAKDTMLDYTVLLTPPQHLSSFEHTVLAPRSLFERPVLVIPQVPLETTPQYFIIRWTEAPLSKQTQVYLVRFEKPNERSYARMIVYILLCVGLLSGFLYGGYVLLRSRTKRNLLSATTLLNERERLVLELVIKKPGITQAEILHLLSYTKSSLSKIVSRLCQRGLVRLEKWGKTNKLYCGERLHR